MMYSSLYGRLGKDAQPIATRSGKPMTAASLAVDVSPRDAEATAWVRVIAFGKLADRLAGHLKGESVSVSGRMELTHWTGDDGAERESWQLIADSLHSARTVRPTSKSGARDTRSRSNDPASGGTPFNDDISF
jgi:single-stranded DNA-binding protein